MVFYNQPESPCAAVRQEADGRFAFALDRLPATIVRLVIAASIEGAQTMGQSRSMTLTFADSTGSHARLATTAGAFAAERALMVAELYRKDGAWRCWASLQGFNGGLDALLTHFGGTLAEPEPAADPTPASAAPARISTEKKVAQKAPQLASLAKTAFNGLGGLLQRFGGTPAEPAPPADPTPVPAADPTPVPAADPTPAPAAPARTSMEETVAQKAPQLVSLAKTAAVVLEKRRLLDTGARVVLVLDASASMNAQYKKGRVQEVVERIVPLAVHFDDDGALDCWAFADIWKELTQITLDNVAGYIQRERVMNSLGTFNDETGVIRTLIEIYRNSKLPVYVIFISDGGVEFSGMLGRYLIDSSGLPIFWQFVGIGGSNYGILEALDTLPDRVVDNANFFALDDLHSISEAELYERLLGEFPDWLVAARRAGVLR
jgi:hypothetical protein